MPHKRKHHFLRSVNCNWCQASVCTFFCEVDRRTSPSALGFKWNTMCLYPMPLIEASHSTEALHSYCSTEIALCQWLYNVLFYTYSMHCCIAIIFNNYKTMVPFPSWLWFYETLLVWDSLLGHFQDCPEGACHCVRAIKSKQEKEHLLKSHCSHLCWESCKIVCVIIPMVWMWEMTSKVYAADE